MNIKHNRKYLEDQNVCAADGDDGALVTGRSNFVL